MTAGTEEEEEEEEGGASSAAPRQKTATVPRGGTNNLPLTVPHSLNCLFSESAGITILNISVITRGSAGGPPF